LKIAEGSPCSAQYYTVDKLVKGIMRKQYHFRLSEKGLLAWDVDRLIEQAKDLEILRVALAEIKELEEPYWFAHGDKPTCRRIVEHIQLIEASDLKFPVILSSDGGIMDGMHRVAKALLRGDKTIDAKKFLKTPEPDFVGVDPEELPY